MPSAAEASRVQQQTNWLNYYHKRDASAALGMTSFYIVLTPYRPNSTLASMPKL